MKPHLACTVLILTAMAPAANLGLAQEADPAVIHIGIVDSLLKNLAPGRKDLIDSELPDLVQEFTGFKSQVIQGGNPFAAGQKLTAGQWHLGFFQGVEFAWAQAKDPKLQPLLLAVKGQRTLHALLVAKKDDPLKGFTDLKGKGIYVLQYREHCRLFAGKGAQGNAKKFFGQVSTPKNEEAALDDILRGKVQAAVVDNSTLDFYKEIHPGRADRLKVLAKSEPFPAKVIAYRQGNLSDRALKKFREGMLKANESPKGQRALTDVGITTLERLPVDYQQILRDILKAYPGPTQ